MNEQIYDEEIVVNDESSLESVLSSGESDNSLEDKLDRVEALLNEEITYRESQELSTESGDQYIEPVISSGVDSPDYSQYIYDLLTDSTIKVEIVDSSISEKPLNNYSVSEVLLVLVLGAFVVSLFSNFLDKYIFKFHRR